MKIDRERIWPALALGGLLTIAISGSLYASQFENPLPYNREHPAAPPQGNGDAAIGGGISFDRKDADKRENEDQWWNKFADHSTDWLLVIFTGLLVYVTNRLVNSTNKLWEAGEKQLAAAARMEVIAKQQTAIQGAQTDIQAKQHALSRLQYIAANRPILEVRYVHRLSDEEGISSGYRPVRVEFEIVNTGPITADLIGSEVRLDYFIGNEWPSPHQLDGDTELIVRQPFGLGATNRYTVEESNPN
ncbi:MAG TPA: hypothetical protein VF449_06345, partial [Parvibaculum sp.]